MDEPTTTTTEGTFAEVVAIPTKALRNRDAKGRFQCPPLHIDFVRSRGTLWTDDSGDSHSRRHCGDVSGRTRRTTTSGWLCSTCIAVDGDVPVDDPKPTKCGSARCEGCYALLPMKKYPTALLTGVGQVRDFRVCRSCRKSGVTPIGELGVDANDADALAAAVASDWRPRRRWDRVTRSWVPDGDATTPRPEWWDEYTDEPVLGPDPRSWDVPWAIGAHDDTRNEPAMAGR